MLPPALPLTHSNTLEPLILQVERVMGIEPTYDAWEAPALPLSYTRRVSRRARSVGEAAGLSKSECLYSSLRARYVSEPSSCILATTVIVTL